MKGAAAFLAVGLAASPVAEIAQGNSASEVLERWCASHHPGAVLRADREDESNPAGPEVRRALRATADEAIAYRRVRLTCAAEVLSEADNWYVPARLTREMNRILESTDRPFGLVVKPLAFTRATVAAHAREVRAVLKKPDGTPFSYVVEDYAPELAPP